MTVLMSFNLKDPASLAKSKILGIFAIALVCIGAVGIYLWTAHKPPQNNTPVVDWGLFRKYDPNSNTAPPELQALDGLKVRSPGFMVPLEDNRSEVTEFLLVPNPQACIHVPPPPPNQMVYVRMVGQPAKTIYGPVMIEGTLRLTNQSHQYGTASFQIYGDTLSPYKGD